MTAGSLNLLQKISGRLQRVASWARICNARLHGVSIGSHCRMAPRCELHILSAPPRRGRIRIGERCDLSTGVTLHPYGGKIKLGDRVFVGPFVVIYGHGGVEIGAGTLIAMHCRIVSSNHAVLTMDRPMRGEPDILQPVKIGRDVWLGAGVTVLGGVTIGDGCVVGAGAVVHRDLPAGSVAVGVPAHVIRNRAS
jgi:acetyltransferase-like isoleucine patch superfamily enzyme